MRRLVPALCLLVLLLPGVRAGSPPGGTGWTLVQETRVRIEGRLLLRRASAPPAEAPVHVVLSPGRPVATAAALGEREPLRAGLVFTAEPLEESGRIRVRVEADVQVRGTPPGTTTRVLDLDPDRAALVELWADEPGDRRLVLVLSATLEEVPRLERVTPRVQPVDLLVEVIAGEGAERRTIEHLHLAALVGSPARYALASLPRDAATGEPPRFRVELELLPLALREGELELRARVSVRRRPVAAASEDRDVPGKAADGRREAPREAGDPGALLLAEASTSGRLRPGSSLELPLPRRSGTAPITFRVTAFF